MAPVTTYGLLQREPALRRTWLSFEQAPPADVRSQLRATGWSFRDAGRGWMYPSLTPPLPRGVTFGEGRDCRYSAVRRNTPEEVLAVLRCALAVARRRSREAKALRPTPIPRRGA